MKNFKNEARKCAYAPPAVNAVQLQTESIICESNPGQNPDILRYHPGEWESFM